MANGQQQEQPQGPVKYIATRDIKFGSIDGDKVVTAGTEIPEGQIEQYPAGTYRRIDAATFPGGKCPTCGTVIGVIEGAPGVPPKPVENPPSTQKDAPQGDAATRAASDSMRNRPDNADSGMPSWGKIPIDVEDQLRSRGVGAQVQRPTPVVTDAAGVGMRAAQRQPLSDEDRRRSAETAPKPDPNAPNMGGFGGTETEGSSGAGGGPKPTTEQQGRGKGGAAKP